MKFLHKIEKMFILGFKQMQDPYYQGFAAQVAFFLFLSIMPTIILLTQILGLFDISMDTAVQILEDYTGKKMPRLFNALFEFSSAGYGNIVFAVIALWAGSRASFSIQRITNYTLTDGKSTGRNYFIERLRAVRTILFTILTIVFSIVILVYGELIMNSILGILNIEPTVMAANIWIKLRWLLGWFLYFAMVSYNYWIMPTVRVTFKSVIPGSIFASVGMLVVTLAYSKYTSTLGNYDVLYGALSSVIGLLMWFFLLAWVLFFGILCNKVWSESDNSDEALSKYVAQLPALRRKIKRRVLVTIEHIIRFYRKKKFTRRNR